MARTQPTGGAAAPPPSRPLQRDTGRGVRLAVIFAAAIIVGAVLVRSFMESREAPPLAPPRPRPAQPVPGVDPTQAMQPAPVLAPAPTVAEPVPAAAPSEPTPAPAEQPAAAVPSEPSQPSTLTVPAPPAAAAATSSSALLEQARALEKAGKPRQALELIEQAVALDPNAPLALSRLSFGYLNRGDNKRAAEFAARAVAVDPTSSEGWIVLGAARAALGDGKGAREAYRNCVEIGTGEYVTECRRVAR